MKPNLHRTLRRIRALQDLSSRLFTEHKHEGIREINIRISALTADLTLLRWCNEEKIAMEDCLRVLLVQPQYRLSDASLVAQARRYRKRLGYAIKVLKIERAKRRMTDVEKEFDRWCSLAN